MKGETVGENEEDMQNPFLERESAGENAGKMQRDSAVKKAFCSLHNWQNAFFGLFLGGMHASAPPNPRIGDLEGIPQGECMHSP